MMDSIYSCFRVIRSIHRGLYDAWIFGFFINDDPSKLVQPEYLATVKVGESIGKRVIKNSGVTKLKLRLEERVNDVASHCFKVPPFPFRRRKIKPRSGKKKGQERIDITIFSNSSILEVSKAVIELKLVTTPYHLKPDLKRNKVLMELADSRCGNNLQLACLGFIVVDDKSLEDSQAKLVRDQIRSKYQKLADQYASNEYVTHVSVRELCSPPNDEDRVGEFIHMISVVISFLRIDSPNKAFQPTPKSGAAEF